MTWIGLLLRVASWTIPRPLVDRCDNAVRRRCSGAVRGAASLRSWLGMAVLDARRGRGARAQLHPPRWSRLYTSLEMPPPTAERMTVCYGFICRRRILLAFTPAERTAADGHAWPRARLRPRRSARRSSRPSSGSITAWAARSAPTKRVANADIRTLDAESQFRLLRHHAQRRRACCWCSRNGACCATTRSPIRATAATSCSARLPHNTAVIAERASGAKWIVDMWTTDFGKVPDVMTLEKWLTRIS